ncbi:sulfotransferase family protein [Gloeobacter morelensis]|uniref:Sulfotransferase n=1 Tax=Gloeobacter morelensis MG652769 TaxID=2781736 RepID=A0ABY3PNZ4_9CYAN|nr:sulfotransferase [Gloeobacter morelensis]UFP95420.1 sulfotransferase [Gloeobacter morelensis MG652769]
MQELSQTFGTASRQPMIFVVGNSRSGTTMMGRILARHPEIFTFHELHFFEEMFAAKEQAKSLASQEAARLFARLIDMQRVGYLQQRDPNQFLAEAEGCISQAGAASLTAPAVFEAFLKYETALNDGRIACDQTPRNVYYLPEILRIYPQARIINMVRDPRDVLLSQKRRWQRRFLSGNKTPLRESLRTWVNYHPITISRLWNAAIRAAEREQPHPRIFHLRFEDVVAEPEGTVRSLCDFLELQYSQSMLEVPQIGSSTTADRPEVRGINRDRAGSWQKGGLSLAEIALCQSITKVYMERNGYKPQPVRLPVVDLVTNSASFPLKLGLAFLLNLNRMRSITETIKRRLA